MVNKTFIILFTNLRGFRTWFVVLLFCIALYSCMVFLIVEWKQLKKLLEYLAGSELPLLLTQCQQKWRIMSSTETDSLLTVSDCIDFFHSKNNSDVDGKKTKRNTEWVCPDVTWICNNLKIKNKKEGYCQGTFSYLDFSDGFLLMRSSCKDKLLNWRTSLSPHDLISCMDGVKIF